MSEQEKQPSFEDNLKPYEMPDDVCLGGPCKLCGRPMHLVKINKLVGFYIHTPEDSEYCASRNNVSPGHPVIVVNGHYRRVLDENYRRVKQLEEKAKESCKSQK